MPSSLTSFLPSLAACPKRLGFLTVRGGLVKERGVCPLEGPARGDLPLLKVALPLLLDVLGLGTANSPSQLSSGNGTVKAGLGGIFGLGLSVACVAVVCRAARWGVLLFISVFNKVSKGPWAKSSSSPLLAPPAGRKFMVHTRLVARRTSRPRAFTRIFLVAGGRSDRSIIFR